MSALPATWAKAPIGSLCSLMNGRAFKPTEWSATGLPIVRIQNLNNPAAPFNRFPGAFDPRHYLAGGELLFAWSGTPGTSFGAHLWRGGEALLNQHIFRVDFDERQIDKRFFRFAINQKLTELIDVAHGGAGLQHVTKGVFEATEISLPSREEQQRIAEKLDTVLARVDACRDRLARVAPLLKRFRQSVLAAATSGQLTEEWRERNGVAKESWSVATVGQLVSGIEAGLNVSCEERPPEDGERGLVKISAVTWGVFDQDQSKTLSADARVSELVRIREGDFLISRANTLELVGACVLVHSVSRNLYLSDKVLRLVMPARVKPWLLCVLRSERGRSQIEQLASGNQLSMRNLSQAGLKSIQVPMPRPNEIDQIVRRVETLFAFADRLEARLAQAQTAVDRLTPSLLAKAFRGELVPQDPADEPAAELLKRMAAQREAAPARPRRQRTAA